MDKKKGTGEPDQFSRQEPGPEEELCGLDLKENEHRKDLTPSEKVEIARKIEETLAGRQGNPTGTNQHSSGNPQKIAEFQPQGESRDIAAKAVDMNRETYRQAKAVVDSGDRGVVRKMVDMTPNYFKTPEEDAAIIAKRYKKVYGKWPPWMPEGPGQESTEE